MIETTVFILLSTTLLVFTLKRPYRHRFYRFFAFTSVLGLVLRQARVWFLDPFSFPQILAWILLVGSAVLAAHALWLLKAYGNPVGDIENTTRLVRRGAYRYIRHPLYASLLLLGAGAALKRIEFGSVLILSALVLFVILTARMEEKDNLLRFGKAYTLYLSETKMFIPYVY